MHLQTTSGVMTDSLKNWMASQEFAHLVDTCTLFDSRLDESRRTLSAKVAARCVSMARAIGLNEIETVQLELAARVHRVGELFLHESLRQKSFLDMSGIEMKAYRHYPLFSAFRLSDDAPVICDVVLKHREYCVGEGFVGEERGATEIPLSARILCVATEYEELIMYRGSDRQIEDSIQRRMFKNTVDRYHPKAIEALMLSIASDHVVH